MRRSPTPAPASSPCYRPGRREHGCRFQVLGEGPGLERGIVAEEGHDGLNWAATGLVLSFSQFTTVSLETPNISAVSRCRTRRLTSPAAL